MAVDVLERLFAHVLKSESEPISHVIADGSGNSDAAWPSNAFQPRRHIDAVAEYVVTFDDHVAQIDADTELDAAVLRHILRPSIPRWISAEQATAFTTLGNSTSMPSR